jgi:uncharacterized repeat protein (TIGR01451 family)
MKPSIRESATAVVFTIILACTSLLVAALPTQAATHTPANSTISNTATVTYNDDYTNSYSASSTVTVTVLAVYEASLSCTPASDVGFLNKTTYYTCTITNIGNADNTFALGVSVVGTGTASLIADSNGNGSHDSGEVTTTNTSGVVAADGTHKFFVAVAIPGTAANGQTNKATVSISGTDSGAGDDKTFDVTTTVQAPVLNVTKKVRNTSTLPPGTFADSCTAKPTDVLEYQVKVTNGGSIQAKNVKLVDTLNVNLTYVADTLFAGADPNTSAANAPHKSDTTTGDATCGSDACGAANQSGGTVTFFLGNGATEIAGGTLQPSSTVYVYYSVTVK